MDVGLMSLYVNLCGMIFECIHPFTYAFAVGLNVKGKRVFLRFDFYVLIVPINFVNRAS